MRVVDGSIWPMVRTNLLSAGASCHVAAMSADSRLTTEQERRDLFKRIAETHPALLRNLEEEVVTPYPAARKRLEHAGAEVHWEQ